MKPIFKNVLYLLLAVVALALGSVVVTQQMAKSAVVQAEPGC